MIIVTRPSPYGEELVQLCHQAMLPAKHLPFFRISTGGDLDTLQRQLNRLQQGDIVITVSPQVVNQIYSSNLSIEFPDFIHYFAVGKKSAQQFQTLCQQSVGYPPVDENSEGLINYLHSIKLPVNQRRVLILCGDKTRPVMTNSLCAQGALVTKIECYNRHVIEYSLATFQANSNDYLVITSIEHLLQLEHYYSNEDKQQVTLIVSSNVIMNAAKKKGWQHIYVSLNANNQNLFKTIVTLCHNDTKPLMSWTSNAPHR